MNRHDVLQLLSEILERSTTDILLPGKVEPVQVVDYAKVLVALDYEENVFTYLCSCGNVFKIREQGVQFCNKCAKEGKRKQMIRKRKVGE